MTYNDLKREVEALGFGERIADDSALAVFANRALRRIFTDRGSVRTLKLYAMDNTPKIVAENVVYTGSVKSFALSGSAYCVEVAGEGSFLVTSGENIYEREFNTEGECFKGFISGSSKISFRGKHSYLIRRVATFSRTFGSDSESIPNADGRTVINVASRVGDFLCFTGVPTDKNGLPITPISMEDGVITLPDSFVGELYVSYLRMPRRISPTTPDEPIDVMADCEHLLSLLCASHVYLECDSEQARYYAELYEKELRALTAVAGRSVSAHYVDVTGWA